MGADFFSALQVLVIGNGGAEHLPQPSPMGLTLAMQCAVQKGYVASQAPNHCMEDVLNLAS